MSLSLPLYSYPKLDIARLCGTDFFPARPLSLGELGSKVCIATKNRTLGDALVLTTLPRRLHAARSDLQIRTYVRGFNPVVFYGNPHVQGVAYLPGKIFGDDVNWGEGHLIQQKERFFGLLLSEDPRPEIYLTSSERIWAERFIGEDAADRGRKPLCLIHPWGKTQNRILNADVWAKLVARWRERVCFWQLGMPDHAKIPGCMRYFFTPKVERAARRLFSVMERADFFLGVDSGPMHVARAFGVPALIFTGERELARNFERRKTLPYFLTRAFSAFLYEANDHCSVSESTEAQLQTCTDAFFEAQLGRVTAK